MEFVKILFVVILLATFYACSEARFIVNGQCPRGYEYLYPFGCLRCDIYYEETGEDCPNNS